MGTNCALLVADLFLFCYDKISCCLFQMITILKLLKLSILLLDIWMTYLNIDNNFFDSMVNHIYPSEL